MTNTKKSLSRKQVVLLLVLFIFIIIAAILLILFLNRSEPAVATLADQAIAMENVQQITQEVQANVERGMFMTHMNMLWHFTDGESASYDAVMGNSSSNTYPLWFTVTLDDTGEEIFRSGLIPIGTTIAEIKPLRDLDAGTYQATVMVNLMEEDAVTPIETNMGFSVQLVVEN